MAKKYELLREVLNYSTGHVIPVGEVFINKEGTHKYHSENWWMMSEGAVTKPEWFKEVVEKEFVWTDELVWEFAAEVKINSNEWIQPQMEKFKAFKLSQFVPAGKGTANDVLNTELEKIYSYDELHAKQFMNKLAEGAILSGSPLNTEKEYSDKRFDALKKENYYNDLRDANKMLRTLSEEYTEEDLEKAFEAARVKDSNMEVGRTEYKDGDWSIHYAYKYATFQSYLRKIINHE